MKVNQKNFEYTEIHSGDHGFQQFPSFCVNKNTCVTQAFLPVSDSQVLRSPKKIPFQFIILLSAQHFNQAGETAADLKV